MSRITPQTELDQLLALIAAQPDGLGIDAITQSLGKSLERRTLQRRLAVLVKQGRIQSLGAARAVRYVGAPQANTSTAFSPAPLPTLQAAGEVYVPLSPEGEEIKAYVRQPRAMGRARAEQTPAGTFVGIFQAQTVGGALQVQVHRATGPILGKDAGQGGFAHLGLRAVAGTCPSRSERSRPATHRGGVSGHRGLVVRPSTA